MNMAKQDMAKQNKNIERWQNKTLAKQNMAKQ